MDLFSDLRTVHFAVSQPLILSKSDAAPGEQIVQEDGGLVGGSGADLAIVTVAETVDVLQALQGAAGLVFP